MNIGNMFAIGVWAVALVIIALSVFSCLLLWGKLV